VAREILEGHVQIAPTAASHFRDSRLQIVVNNTPGNAAEEFEGAPMALEKELQRLAGKARHETHVAEG